MMCFSHEQIYNNRSLLHSVVLLSERTDVFGVKLLHIPTPGSFPSKIRACEPVTNPPSLGSQNCAWPKEAIKQMYKKDADYMYLVI